ncbi:MAG: ArsB/NhaD family transporter [Microcoleus sp. PH2017_10_PVI_O_A]|uniref:ArsB/NhaD family transporter n=1 Tax=unclassified Microcoleus TaxID=2642155 RepID=UPI001D54FBD7|nr:MULTISPECIES: ArsB/NhaD family transporter [unclassified Microcoleus]TAE75490.1 MAG: transporter [Oscillatoriales cyanobacterium]MCC3409480.1 ArsB/NhaD family transporter [Microcoleus sp. PH2017_10_PVI_O_A]MCC3463737.1 ArsB/NhaD family transporter [Microcoleus sp. PH2017_11_PCY_U_A]MCC3482097.1 ArsB/NhaD family transporter [Microcoleus sp. PH2017_12_PCY_D_A]MCC3530928.1 ArsB/NhaD family transporter [Microcoleus sp. PH2017_21_RUC_O_A]
MENVQAAIAAATFIGVVFLIITEWIHLTVAAFLGALILIFTHVMTLNNAIEYIGRSHGTLGLFFGVMVMVRAFEPTKVFDYLATQMVLLAKGKGKNLLLGIVGITTPICAVLPNATTVMLLAPLIPPMAEEVGVDFVPLLILMVFVANSSGLLTIVGDPATFIVGDAINMSFTDYLLKLSLGGAIAVAVILVILPWLFPEIWHKELDNLDNLPHPKINHPRVLAAGGLIIAFVLTFFVVGESLPVPISPAAVALLGAGLAMLLAHHSKIDSVNNILRDLDWSTLLFFMSIFVLIGGLEKTGVIAGMSGILAAILGKNIFLGSLALLFFVGLMSSVVPNIPLVVAMVPLLKQYVVNIGLAPTDVLAPDFAGQFPPAVLPLFYAMMYGATLGGNGTLVGASSNIVAAGISELHGRRISFQTFLRYGLPVMALQLVAAAIYVTVRFLV